VVANLGLPLAPSQIGLFNGVDAAIHAIFHSYGDRGDTLLTTSPTFGYYTPCAQMQGMAIEALPYRLPDFGFPLEELRAALQGCPRILLICNPNNPTGTRLAPELILELAASAPGTLVVVDELYEAFTGDSVLPLADFDATPNLLVLRSLAKTAGLAGLRIGFAIGAAPVVDRLARVTGPYDINSFAVTAAHAALADQAYVDSYVAEVLRARTWLVQQLQAAGVRHHAAGGNYLLIWPERPAEEVEQRLRQAGILVRSMAAKPLIDGSLRVSIGTTEQMQRFWAAFKLES
jgi:histidinol-phosphate aminotransferase